ncbi:MAG: low specificity L-threonine aldolase, partial [Acidobacteria bacterium]|nr:low specificity L-threonine aldolase [Acidobacteriota bacterium]
AEDHEHARVLARGLAAIDGIEVRNAAPETNMVFFDVSGLGLSNRAFVDSLAAAGVRMGGAGGQIRAVTHLDVSRQGVEMALGAIGRIASAAHG